MAEIKRIVASEEAIKEARKGKFELSQYFVPAGTKLTIAEATFVAHNVDGVDKTAVPVLILYRGENTEINRTYVYLRAVLRNRLDYKNQTINVQGTLNDLVREFSGKTVGELVDHLNTLKGRQVEATVTEYRGINKKGDVQSISLNGYNLL